LRLIEHEAQSMNSATNVDVALLGGGGAGLTLLLAIEREARRRGLPFPSIALVDPVHRSGPDRTWCWWQAAGAQGLTPLLHRSWNQLVVFDQNGRPAHLRLGDLRYVMLRSEDLYDEAGRAAERMGVRRILAAASELRESDDGVLIDAGAEQLCAQWVFDSRPGPPQRSPLTSLLQHFRGWTVRLRQPLLDPDMPTLMDFRVPQPGHGVAFGYCLPLAPDRGLVEYTEFGSRRLTSAGYDEALRSYLRQRWGLSDQGYAIEAVEDGVIPMTDAAYQVRAGERIFRIGTAGGATRGSTGYTMAAVQRQTEVAARRLFDGVAPVPPRAYPSRHRWMDAVLLRALDRQLVSGPDLFFRLFSAVPPARLVRFLDGLSSPADELIVMRSAPARAMIRATAEDAVLRARIRAFPLAGAALGQSTRAIRSVASRYLK
jgi:lycopene beta-cyclase